MSGCLHTCTPWALELFTVVSCTATVVLLISEDRADLWVTGGFLVSSTCALFFFLSFSEGKKQTSLSSQSDKCEVHCTWKQNKKMNAPVGPAREQTDETSIVFNALPVISGDYKRSAINLVSYHDESTHKQDTARALWASFCFRFIPLWITSKNGLLFLWWRLFDRLGWVQSSLQFCFQ